MYERKRNVIMMRIEKYKEKWKVIERKNTK